MSVTAPRADRPPVHPGLRAFRHRDFRLYFTGQLISLVGTWMQSVAQGWLMHRLTSSAFMLGLLSFAQFAPVLPLAMLAGVVVDHTPKRRLLLATQGLMLLQAAALAWTVSGGVVRPWMVIVLAVVYGIANTFDLPARQSIIVEMTGKEDLPNGIALNSAAFNMARIMGPAVAGVMLAAIGEAGCFWVNALSYVAVLVSLMLMRGSSTAAVGAGVAAGGARATMREGFAYAWGNRSIRHLLVLLAVCAGLGFQYNVLLPVYARDVLHASAAVYGWLFSAFGAGSLVAAVRMAVTHERWSLRRHVLIGLVTSGVGLAGFAWSRWLPAMLGFAALAGFGLILYVSSTNTLIQLTVEDRYRGRVMALYTLFFVGTSPFGSLFAGAVAERWGAPVATSLCAIVLLGGAVWVSFRLREVAAREAAEREAAERETVPPPETPA
jgi:MFS family permease